MNGVFLNAIVVKDRVGAVVVMELSLSDATHDYRCTLRVDVAEEGTCWDLGIERVVAFEPSVARGPHTLESWARRNREIRAAVSWVLRDGMELAS